MGRTDAGYGADRARPAPGARNETSGERRYRGASRRAARGDHPEGIPGADLPGDRPGPGRADLHGEDASLPRPGPAPVAPGAGGPSRERPPSGSHAVNEERVMECERLRDDRLDVLYGEGDAATRRRVEEHLAAGAACREARAGLKRLRQDLKAWTLPEGRGPACVPRRATLR